PPLVQSRLSLELPAGTTFVQAATRRGRQQVVTGPKALRLEADLGRAGAVLQARWRQETGPSKIAQMRVREAHFWDLRATSSTLWSVLQYTMTEGVAVTLAVELPEQTEVRSVEARALPGRGPAPRLKEWRVSGSDGKRQLRIEFQSPVTLGVQLALELVPRRPFRSDITLPLPTPLGAQWAEERDGQLPLLAFRVEGLEIKAVDPLRLTGVPTEDFTTFWQTAGRDEPETPARAFSFRRMLSGAPVLRLRLQASSAPSLGAQEIAWRVNARQADLRATARLTAIDDELAVVEWEVPTAVVLTDVSGRDVRYWTRDGGRVQIWLRRSLAAPEVQLVGWMPLALDQPNTRFDLPMLRLLSVKSPTTVL